jgi:hypothetical protein
MDRRNLLMGVLSFGVAVTVYSLGKAKIIFPAGDGTVTIYPALAFALLGANLLYRSVFRKEEA